MYLHQLYLTKNNNSTKTNVEEQRTNVQGETKMKYSEIEKIIHQVLNQNAEKVDKYKESESTRLMSYFVSQVMKASEGKAHPSKVHDLLIEYLEENNPEKVEQAQRDMAASQAASTQMASALDAMWEAYFDTPSTKAEIKGVPSSSQFKKLQKDNAKLAKRVKELEEHLVDVRPVIKKAKESQQNLLSAIKLLKDQFEDLRNMLTNK